MKSGRTEWINDYRTKTIEPSKVGELVKTGDSVFLGSCCGEPQTLVESLLNNSKLKAVKLVNISPPLGPSPYAGQAHTGKFTLQTFFGNPIIKERIKEGTADYIPCHLSAIPFLFREGVIPLDVALIQVSPPDERGFLSLGISVDCAKAAVETAKLVIAEVNSEMPRTLGDSFIQISQIDYVVETSRPLITIAFPEEQSEEEKRIGMYVSQLIPDGATLATGFGKIIDAILYGLTEKRELGIHTGTISDGILKLVKDGIITNRHKTINRGKIITTMAMGTERLYRSLHENPLVEMHPIEYTHNITVLAQLENLVSLNSAFQVDLYGQVNGEVINGFHIGGTGGQVDFVRGSKRSPGGKSIICLEATAKNGTVSRIVPFIPPVTPVTSLRSDIDYVVTEYGIAELRGKPMRERAMALIEIASPAFRDELRSEFRRHWPFSI